LGRRSRGWPGGFFFFLGGTFSTPPKVGQGEKKKALNGFRFKLSKSARVQAGGGGRKKKGRKIGRNFPGGYREKGAPGFQKVACGGGLVNFFAGPNVPSGGLGEKGALSMGG